MLFGYTIGESRHTKGWPNRLQKFYREKETKKNDILVHVKE